MCTERHGDDDDDDDAVQYCRMTTPVEPFTIMDITSKTETYIMSESVDPFTHIDTAMPQVAAEAAFVKTPELHQLNRLFAHIDFEHQQLRNVNDLETSMCEHVIGILGTPLSGVEFWKTKSRINYGEHRNIKKGQQLHLPGRHFVVQT